MAGKYIKPLETLQYLFIERYPYIYKPPMEMELSNNIVRLVKVRRIFGLEKAWTSIPVIGGFVAVVALLRALILVRRHCAHSYCPLLPLKITGWGWMALMVACGAYAYYLLFIKFDQEVTVGLEQLGIMRGRLLLQTKGGKKTKNSAPDSNLMESILVFWMWMGYLITPIAIFGIVILNIDPSHQLMEKFWQHFPFLKVFAIKVALGSILLFHLGVIGGRFLVVLGIVYEIERLGFWFGALALYATNGLIDMFRMHQKLLKVPISSKGYSNVRHINWYNSIRILFQTPEELLSNVAGLGAIAAGSSIVECAYVLVRLHSSLPFKMSIVVFPIFLSAVVCTMLGGDLAVKVYELSLSILLGIKQRNNRKTSHEYKITAKCLKSMRPISIPVGIFGMHLAQVTKACKTVIFQLIFDITVYVLMTF